MSECYDPPDDGEEAARELLGKELELARAIPEKYAKHRLWAFERRHRRSRARAIYDAVMKYVFWRMKY